jgi:hypothetical protein
MTTKEEAQNCMTGINQVLKICWEIVNKCRSVSNSNSGGNDTITMTDSKTVLQALGLINDCNKYKMDLTTNGVATIFWIVFNVFEQLLFFSPIVVFYLPEDAITTINSIPLLNYCWAYSLFNLPFQIFKRYWLLNK